MTKCTINIQRETYNLKADCQQIAPLNSPFFLCFQSLEINSKFYIVAARWLGYGGHTKGEVIIMCCTVGKRNYCTGYGILLHELPVVVVLITQSNNNKGTMKNSILHKRFCKSLFRTSRPIVK